MTCGGIGLFGPMSDLLNPADDVLSIGDVAPTEDSRLLDAELFL